jgi:hypothetical protein
MTGKEDLKVGSLINYRFFTSMNIVVAGRIDEACVELISGKETFVLNNGYVICRNSLKGDYLELVL